MTKTEIFESFLVWNFEFGFIFLICFGFRISDFVLNLIFVLRISDLSYKLC